ncbi:hypothetical protein AAHE00_18175 [Klebsiella oxytoca]|nr:hypothetical protein [Klebsiella oxytoca]MCW9532787.1 hypothetical protein [Klebsiella oxytoca]
MTTDITELAQREKFEAWWEREYKHLESSKYTDAVPHIKYGFWMAYQAGGAELVEALEKAQTINAAAEKLVRCKGRYHSELNYRALAALFGVTTPDLPPLDSESRTVKLPLPRRKTADDYVDDTFEPCDLAAVYNACRLECEVKFKNALTAVGIKWEAE